MGKKLSQRLISTRGRRAFGLRLWRKKIILILALALALRLINLNQSLWLDEGAQALMSSEPLSAIGKPPGEFHPPLFHFLIHFWLKLGKSEWFLRLPSVFFAVATIYFAYLIGKKVFGQKLALLSAFFLAIAPYHLYYSQELRMYSLATFLATASTYFLLEANLLFYFLTVTALLYTYYLGVFLIFAHAVWVLVFQRKIWKRFFYSLSLSFLLFSPWLSQFLKQFSSGMNLAKALPGWAAVANLPPERAFPLTFIKFSLGKISFSNKTLYLVVAASIFIIYGYLLYQSFKKSSHKTLFLWNWLLVPLFVGWFVSFFIPFFQPFRFLYTIIPFYLLLAFGVLALKGSWQKVFVILVVIVSASGLFLYFSQPRFQREDWRAATRFVEAQDPETSVVVFKFSDRFAPYQWYSKGRVKTAAVAPLQATSEIIENRMAEATKEKESVFLFEYLGELTDPNRLVEAWLLGNNFGKVATYNFSGVGFVYNYRKGGV